MLESYKIGIAHALEIPQLPPLINDLADRAYIQALSGSARGRGPAGHTAGRR